MFDWWRVLGMAEKIINMAGLERRDGELRDADWESELLGRRFRLQQLGVLNSTGNYTYCLYYAGLDTNQIFDEQSARLKFLTSPRRVAELSLTAEIDFIDPEVNYGAMIDAATSYLETSLLSHPANVSGT